MKESVDENKNVTNGTKKSKKKLKNGAAKAPVPPVKKPARSVSQLVQPNNGFKSILSICFLTYFTCSRIQVQKIQMTKWIRGKKIVIVMINKV